MEPKTPAKKGRAEHLRRFHFQKGTSGNPKGKPKGFKNQVTILEEALEKVQKEKGISFLEHFVRQAYENERIAVALAKKILPDLIRTEGDDRPGTRVYILQPVDKNGKPLASLPVQVFDREKSTDIIVGNGTKNGADAKHD